MTNVLRRSISIVLAFIMLISCFMILNVTKTSGAIPETLYKFYANEVDANENGNDISNNATDVFTNAITGTVAFTEDTYEVGETSYILTKGASKNSLTIVVPDGIVDATFNIVAKSSNTTARTLTLSKNGVAVDATKTVKTATVVTYTGLSSGTYTLTSSSTMYYSLLTLKIPPHYTVSGTVKDSNGDVVKCATINIDDEYITSTDDGGKYSFPTLAGSYKMTVTALGHSGIDETLTVNKDVTKDYTLENRKGNIYKLYGSTSDAEANYDSTDDNAIDIFPGITLANTSITGGFFDVGGSSYYLTHCSASKTSFTIVVPDAVTDATLYMVLKSGTYATTMSLAKDGVVIDNTKKLPANKTDVISFTNLSGGTYTLTSNRGLFTSLIVLTTSPFHTLSGKLTDSTGTPIKNCAISNSEGLIAKTDIDGNYSLELPDGTNNVTVSALGYVSKKEKIVIENDITRSYKLEKDTSIDKVYTFYGNKIDADTNNDNIDDNAKDIFINANTSTSTSVTTGGLFNVGGSCYELNYAGTSSKIHTIVVPEGVTNANLYMVFRPYTTYMPTANLSKDGTIVGDTVAFEKSKTKVVEYKGLSEGTYTFTSVNMLHPSLLVLTTSPTHIISGTVTYDTDEPVKCATVYIDDEMKAITDGEGKYSAVTSEGSHNIKVTALGCPDAKESLVLDEDTTTDFTLNKNKNKVYKFYGKPADAEANYDSVDDNATDVFTNATAGTNTATISLEPFNIGGSSYTLSHYGGYNNSFTVAVPDAVSNAELYMVFRPYNKGGTIKFNLMKNGRVVDDTQVLGTTSTTSADMIHYKGLSEGTYTVVASNYVNPSLFLLTTSPIYTVSGTVTDTTGTPIKCANVYINNKKLVTDENGQYTTDVTDGVTLKSVKATALGYKDTYERISISKESTKDIVLRKDRNTIYKFYGKPADAEANYDNIEDNATDIFTDASAGTNSYVLNLDPFDIGGSTYDISHCGGARTTFTVVVPEGVTDAELYTVFRPYNSGVKVDLQLIKDETVVDDKKELAPSTSTLVEYKGLNAGTYTIVASDLINPSLLILTASPVYTISGTVTDTTGVPVKCANVYVGDNIKVTTDGEGKYSTDVGEEVTIKNIRVTALGYKETNKSVLINKETTQDIEIHKDRNSVYKFYGQQVDAEANYDSIENNAKDVFTDAATSTGTSKITNGPFSIGGSTYKLTRYGGSRKVFTIEVPEGVENAELYMVLRPYSTYSPKLTLSKDGTVVGDEITLTKSMASLVSYTGLSGGTYKLTSTNMVYPSLFVLTSSPVYTLSGTVTDSEGNPVKCATVYVGSDVTTRTDGDGKYTVDIADGTKISNIKVTAMGYEETNKTVDINGSATQDLVINKAKKGIVYKFFANASDAVSNFDKVSNNDIYVFKNAVRGSYKTIGGNSYNVCGSSYKFYYTSGNRANLVFTIPEGITDADMYMVGKSINAKTTVKLTLLKDGIVIDNQKSLGGSASTVNYTDLSAGTYTLKGNKNFRYSFLAVVADDSEITTTENLNVMVNNPALSSNSTLNVKVQKNGVDIDGVNYLNIGAETEIGEVKKNDIITFTFDQEVAKNITNWNGFNLKSKDTEYTLVYIVGNTITTPTFDYYDKMPTVDLGQKSPVATGYGAYGYGEYNVMVTGRNLSNYAEIKSHQYSLFDVCSGFYDLVGNEYGVADEGILLLGGTDDEVVFTNNVDSTTKVLVIVDCTNKDAIVTAVDGKIYSDYDRTNATEVGAMTGQNVDNKKLQFYVDGGSTINIKGTDTDNYSVLKSIRIFDVNNITTGVTAIDNGLASNISSDSPFASVVSNINSTDRLFTLVGMVNGVYSDTDFINQIDQIGFVLYDADVVDGLGEDAKKMNPQQLKTNYSDTDFGEATIQTNTVYKNFYDVNEYDETFDSENGYTGETSLEESEEKSYFAYLVALSEGKRYYAYPFTTYSGASQSSFDATVENKIEMSNN